MSRLDDAFEDAFAEALGTSDPVRDFKKGYVQKFRSDLKASVRKQLMDEIARWTAQKKEFASASPVITETSKEWKDAHDLHILIREDIEADLKAMTPRS